MSYHTFAGLQTLVYLNMSHNALDRVFCEGFSRALTAKVTNLQVGMGTLSFLKAPDKVFGSLSPAR